MDLVTANRFVETDIAALEEAIRREQIVKEPHLGVELEVGIVRKDDMEPAPLYVPIAAKADSAKLVPELGTCNAEINFTPVPVGPECLHRMEDAINEQLRRLRIAAEELDARILLTGIIPTFRMEHAVPSMMTQTPRLTALRTELRRRHGHQDFKLDGMNGEINVRGVNLDFEAMMLAFQDHLCIGAERFGQAYDLGLATIPVALALATYSRIILGEEGWASSRWPIWLQIVGGERWNRTGQGTFGCSSPGLVNCGPGYIGSESDAIVNYFRYCLENRGLVLGVPGEPSPEDAQFVLKNLRAANKCWWTPQRPCVTPHGDRIALHAEHRTFPSGPSVVDMMANMVFRVGTVLGFLEQGLSGPDLVEKKAGKINLFSAAKHGAEAQVYFRGAKRPVREVALDFLPIAEKGWEAHGVSPEESRPYLEIIRRRVEDHKTPDEQLLRAWSTTSGDRKARTQQLAHWMNANQWDGPIHTWSTDLGAC